MVSTIVATSVSAEIYNPSASTLSLSARSLIWRADSSPLIYKTFFVLQRLWQIWSKIVDLPMPGSPESSTKLPSTIPPPKTLSNSLIPEVNRVSMSLLISDSFCIEEIAALVLDGEDFLEVNAIGCCSSIVFHSPQVGHFPYHFTLS